MSYPNFDNDLDDENEDGEAAKEAELLAKAAQVKVMRVHGHSVDRNHILFKDEKGRNVLEYEGYVPGVGIGGGDDIELLIDIKTGQILNWKELTPEDIVKVFMDEL